MILLVDKFKSPLGILAEYDIWHFSKSPINLIIQCFSHNANQKQFNTKILVVSWIFYFGDKWLFPFYIKAGSVGFV